MSKNEQALIKVVEALDKISLVYGLSKRGNILNIELSLDNVEARAEDE